MFHDCRQRQVERLGQRADRKIRLFGEPRDQRAARRVGERGEGAVERGGAKLNHVVKYRNGTRGVKPASVGVRGRGADELDAVGAGPFGGTCHFADFAAGAVDQ